MNDRVHSDAAYSDESEGASLMRTCAVYARYSSDRQSAVSIDDQIRKCKEHAARQGWTVLEDHIYSDRAVSGATDHRDGLKALLTVATSAQRPFQIVLLDDTSRLSRKIADSLRILDRLNFAGVRLVFVSQGIDTSSEQAEVLMATHGIVDQLYIRELSSKTRRGVEGRALKGLHTGGRVFGYKNIPIEDPTRQDAYGRPQIVGARLAVNASQAEIIRRIFTLYASGYSLKRLARKLNEEGVQSPRPQKGRFSRSWCPSSLRVILHNERYRGVVTWGKTRKERSPITGKRVKRNRNRCEWVNIEIPEQRIISEELWSQVQARIAHVKRVYGFGDLKYRSGLLRARAVSSKYLFSGLMKCGACGASIAIVSGGGLDRASARYGCPINAFRGQTICPNSVRVRRDVLERDLLSELQSRVLNEDVIAYTLERFEQELTKNLEALTRDLEGMSRRKVELDQEIRNLTDKIASGDPSLSIMAAITERERELSGIANRLLESSPGSVRARVGEIRRFVLSQLGDLRALIGADVSDTLALKAELTKHIQAITLEPTGERKVVAKGNWNLLGLTSRMECAGGES